MGINRIFLEQIDQSGATTNYVIAWNGSAWVPTVVTVPDGDKGDINIASGIWSIEANAVTIAKLQQVNTSTFLGRSTASTGNVEVLSATQATALLNPFTTTVKGLVPAPATTSGRFLKDDGTWAAPPTGTYVTDGDKGDITISSSGSSYTIDTGSVSLTKLASLAANSIIGNNTGSSATPLALTAGQVTAMLNSFSSTLKGLVPASGGGTENFLRADGVWTAPASPDLSGKANLTGAAFTGNVSTSGTLTATGAIQGGSFATADSKFTSASGVTTIGGAGSSLTIATRDTGNGWSIYNTGGSLRFWESGDRLTLSSTAAAFTVPITVSGTAVSLAGHTHAIADITSLQSALDAKASLAANNVFTGNNTFGDNNADLTTVVGNLAITGGAFTQPYIDSASGSSEVLFKVAGSPVGNVGAGSGLFVNNVTSGSGSIVWQIAGATKGTLSTTGLSLVNAISASNFSGSSSGTNTGDQTKTSLGLGNVDNTSDANKPVSTAQQAALDLKAKLAGGNIFTGDQIINGFLTDDGEGGFYNAGSLIIDADYPELAILSPDSYAQFKANTQVYFSAFNRTATAAIPFNIRGEPIRFQMYNGTNVAVITSTGVAVTGALSATGEITGSNLSGTHTGSSSGTNTGDQTISLTGDITGSGTGSFATTIGANKVTLANLAQVGTATFLGRMTAATGNVEALTAAQATSLLSNFTTTSKGLVPNPTTSTGRYLKDDGTWAAVATGSSSFIALTDTDPTTYTGSAGKAVIVNAGETGLDFTASALGSAAYSNTSAFAAASHVHAIADITNLQNSLNAKLNSSAVSTFALTLLDDTTAEAMHATLLLGSAATADAAAFAAAVHTHAIADVTGLSTALSSKEPTISSGTTSQYWRGDKTWQTLNKTAVGLANVDNTSDASKPVSTATQTALDLKSPIANPSFTGTVTLPGDPTLALHAATKQYVDSVAQGLDPKASVLVASTSSLTLSGEQTIDGILTSASRVLVMGNGAGNGIYVTASGAWTRATDMDTWAEVPSSFVFVERGTAYGDTGWVCTADQGGTIGSTSMAWTQFAGAGEYSGINGITISGKNISLTDMPGFTLKGNGTGATTAPANLNATEVTAMLNSFVGANGTVGGTKGLVPAPAATDNTKYLRGDGSWQVLQPVTDGDKGDLTISGSGATYTIDANAVSLGKLAQITSATFLGRTSASTGNVEALTGTQATAMLDSFTSALKGLVPASGGGTANFLRADGQWATPSTGESGFSSFTTAGTGASQNITIPAASSADQLYVFINGIYQMPDTNYTVSGTTLTITTPVAGDTIIISKPGSGPAGQAASIAIGTTQSGETPSVTNVGTSYNAVLNFVIPQGVKGDTGNAATLSLGTVSTGAAGSSVSITNSGTINAATYNFTIPRGDTGIQGPSGTLAVGTVTTGSAGSSAIVSNVGTSQAATLNFTIPRGDTGAAATVAVGTTTTGAAGSSASVTNSGSSSAATFNFTVPRGDTGIQGPSGTLAVGTVTTGAAGSSATVSNVGTSQAATLNFSIPRGDQGIQGNPGNAATIAVGTVTTGSAGSSATVTNAGTSSAASFNFTIPRGDTGVAATVAVGTVTTGAAGSSASVTNGGTSSAASFNFTIPRGDQGIPGVNAMLGWNGAIDGLMADGEVIMLGFAPSAITLTQASCKAMALTGATGSTTLTIRKKTSAAAAPTTVGTIVFAAAGQGAAQDGTVTISSSSISSGDLVYIDGPATADTTLANVAYMIRA